MRIRHFTKSRQYGATIVLSSFFLAAPVVLTAAAVVPLTLTNQATLAANDDGSTDAVSLNIDGAAGINFFGVNTTTVFVNNNGNITFQSALPTYTPNGLATGVGQPIIAPYFADVDTRGTGSGLVTYGNATYNGNAAFVVDYPNVGYFDSHVDKLADFQLILSARPDTGVGNFDIEYNYNTVQWETGDASGGTSGLGGVSAAVGYSNGSSGTGNVFYQVNGSLVNGALIDGGANALISNSLNSNVAGRYDFEVRNGQVIPNPSPEPMSFGMLAAGFVGLFLNRKKLMRRS